MGRANWLDDENHPVIDEHLEQLEHFTSSMADGVIDQDELDKQEKNLIAAMKAVESELSDDQHAKVTKLLAELSAYNVMAVLHGLAAEHARRTFSSN